jgi:hypothetical protein
VTWELSSLSGSSASSPEVMARRREFSRVPRFEMAADDLSDAKYEVILKAASTGWRLHVAAPSHWGSVCLLSRVRRVGEWLQPKDERIDDWFPDM